MGAVHGVACLKSDHSFPAALSDLLSDAHGRAKGLRKILFKVGVVEDLNGS